jgi:hypothetical protein
MEREKVELAKEDQKCWAAYFNVEVSFDQNLEGREEFVGI